MVTFAGPDKSALQNVASKDFDMVCVVRFTSACVFLLLTALTASAVPPAESTMRKYEELWSESPFTIPAEAPAFSRRWRVERPAPSREGEEKNPPPPNLWAEDGRKLGLGRIPILLLRRARRVRSRLPGAMAEGPLWGDRYCEDKS